MTDRRKLLQETLKATFAKAEEVLTEYIKENPDVFQRGPQEYLTPNMTGPDATAMRKELKGLDTDAFWAKVEEIAQATSVEEAAKLLAGGKL